MKTLEEKRIQKNLSAKRRYKADPQKYCAKRRAQYAENPDWHRDWHCRRAYGISLQQKILLLKSQGNRCGICRKDTPNGGKKLWHIDHCHKTGQVRGILCHTCNAGGGQFNDNSWVLLMAAVWYSTGILGKMFYVGMRGFQNVARILKR